MWCVSLGIQMERKGRRKRIVGQSRPHQGGWFIYMIQSLSSETWHMEDRQPQESVCVTRCHITQRTPNRTTFSLKIVAIDCYIHYTFTNVGTAAQWCWQEGPIWLLLWQSSPLRKNEIYVHVVLLSCEERDKNGIVRDHVSTEGVENCRLLPSKFL